MRKCKVKKLIPGRVVDYLTPKALWTALFYTLPKIHKANNPGCPIISANEKLSPMEKISAYVDHFIRPLAKRVESYVKDTGHFLDLIKEIGHVPPSTILCTINISALYTSIPHEEGIMAMRNALSNQPFLDPSTDVLYHLTKMILQNNEFKFDGRYYHQVQGTVMGTKMALSYAILFMSELEKKILDYTP